MGCFQPRDCAMRGWPNHWTVLSVRTAGSRVLDLNNLYIIHFFHFQFTIISPKNGKWQIIFVLGFCVWYKKNYNVWTVGSDQKYQMGQQLDGTKFDNDAFTNFTQCELVCHPDLPGPRSITTNLSAMDSYVSFRGTKCLTLKEEDVTTERIGRILLRPARDFSVCMAVSTKSSIKLVRGSSTAVAAYYITKTPRRREWNMNWNMNITIKNKNTKNNLPITHLFCYCSHKETKVKASLLSAELPWKQLQAIYAVHIHHNTLFVQGVGSESGALYIITLVQFVNNNQLFLFWRMISSYWGSCCLLRGSCCFSSPVRC